MSELPLPPCVRCGGEMRRVAGSDDEASCPGCGSSIRMMMVSVHAPAEEDPAAAAARQQQTNALRRAYEQAAVDALSFAVYGLDGRWTGRRSIEGWKGDPPERLTLQHGHPFDASMPEVRVDTARADDRERARRELAIMSVLRLARRAGGLTPEIRSAIDHVRPQEQWESVPIAVEGAVVLARVFRLGISWVGLLELDEVDLVVSSRGLEPSGTRLVAIDDLTAYLEGGESGG